MTAKNLTIEILKEIRDEIRKTNARLDQTNARLDQTNSRLDQTNVRLDQSREELAKRITESEIRTATAITELTGTLVQVRDLLTDRLNVRDRVENCEKDILLIKAHLKQAS